MLLLFVCLCTSTVPAMKSNAEESPGEQASSKSGLKDENTQRLEEVIGMDENGNIFTVEETEGTVQNASRAFRAARASSVKVVNFRTKGNAVTNYTECGTGAAGYTNGAYGGDAAYLGTSNGKVKFMLSGVVGEVAASEVQVVDKSSIAVVSCYMVENGRLIHKIAHDITTPGWATKLDNGAAPSYLKSGTTYYGYDGHYFYTDYATMLSDYQNNSRSRSVNPKNPYYNYYQYLPLRSKTNYSASALNSMINSQSQVTSSSKMYNLGNAFVTQQNTYGVNALLMAGVAANESAWGTSNISQSKNNLFGLNAVDSSPGTSANTYANVGECVRQFAEHYMSRQYLYPSNWKYNGGFLGNKASGINVKYASDPYWGEKAANLIYRLEKSGGNKDYNAYTIGIKDTVSTTHNNVNVRNGSNTSSTALYKTGKSSNYAMILQNKTAENDFYRIQSDGVLNSDRTALVSGDGKYSYDKMYAYISADYVVPVNQGNDVAVPVKTLQSIYLGKAPSKTVYTEGEKFDASGMKVMARWSDGTETDVTAQSTYPSNTLSAGTTSIKITYTYEGVAKSVEQKITVNVKTSVTSIAVSPEKIELNVGESYTFGAQVIGTGNLTKKVVWSVEGAQSKVTKIDENGKLQVSEDESADKLTVRATSTDDQTQSAVSEVVVVKPEKPEENIPDTEQPDENSGDDLDSNDEPSQTETKDENTGIVVKGELPEEVKLTVETVKEDSEHYETYIEQVKTQTVLGVFDITLSETLAEGQKVTLTFPIDEKHNGKEVMILHYSYKEGGAEPFTEKYVETVKDGMVTIEVTGFSPYVVALNDPKEEPETSPSDEPADGDTNLDGGGDNVPSLPNGDGSVPPSDDGTPDTGDQNTNSQNTNDQNVNNQNTNNQNTNTPSTQAGDHQGAGSDVTDNDTNNTTNNIENTTTDTGDTNNNSSINADNDEDKTVKDETSGVNVIKQPLEKAAPKTGDVTPIAVWGILLLIAGIGIAVVVVKKRKCK